MFFALHMQRHVYPWIQIDADICKFVGFNFCCGFDGCDYGNMGMEIRSMAVVKRLTSHVPIPSTQIYWLLRQIIPNQCERKLRILRSWFRISWESSRTINLPAIHNTSCTLTLAVRTHNIHTSPGSVKRDLYRVLEASCPRLCNLFSIATGHSNGGNKNPKVSGSKGAANVVVDWKRNCIDF